MGWGVYLTFHTNIKTDCVALSVHFDLPDEKDSKLADTYVEIIGQAIDSSTIKMMACLNLGPNLGASNCCSVRGHAYLCFRHENCQRYD